MALMSGGYRSITATPLAPLFTVLTAS